MTNNSPNNPNYDQQALAMDAIEAARHQQQEQVLNQTINKIHHKNLTQEQNDLALCLVRCGLDSPRMLYGFLQEGFYGLCDLQSITLKDMTDMSARISRKPASQGPVNIGTIVLKRVESLAYWAKQQITCSDPLQPEDFTREVRDGLEAQMLAADSQKNAEEEIASKSNPGKIQTEN